MVKGSFARIAAMLTSLLATTHAYARHNSCVETADVVGETRCRNFGGFWATERSVPLFVSLGTYSSFLSAPLVGNVIGGRGLQIDGSTLSPTGLRAHGGEVRMGGHFSRYVYGGFGMGVALGNQAATHTVDVNGYQVSLGDGINVYHGRLAWFVGFRVPLGRVSLRLEMPVALQMIGFQMKAIAPDGTKIAGGGHKLGVALDPRVMVDLWVTPDTTLSLWTGANLLRPGDFAAGLMIGGHLRAFDGADK